ncbi:MAG: dihydrodipicolinate synthase family protein [Pseudomonadota bacterium]
MSETMKGVLAPVVTPFLGERPDAERLIDHCRWLIGQDCGLAVFGTNSEGNSLSVAEKIELIDALVEAGLPAARMMPGAGACALPDAVALCSHVAQMGCGGALVLPPFYYKDATDEGLFAFFADLIEGVGDARLRLYLYHIPPVAAVGFSLDLIARLIEAYPGVVAGIKDSSRDDANTFAMLERFPGWGVFPGNETNLPAFVKAGAVGTISATCNVNAAGIVDLYRNARAGDADQRLASVNRVRSTFARWPMIAAMKSAIADARHDDVWRALRPPLLPLGEEESAALRSALDEIGFALAPLPAAATP